MTFCKKETYNFKEPTNRSHPIPRTLNASTRCILAQASCCTTSHPTLPHPLLRIPSLPFLPLSPHPYPLGSPDQFPNPRLFQHVLCRVAGHSHENDWSLQRSVQVGRLSPARTVVPVGRHHFPNLHAHIHAGAIGVVCHSISAGRSCLRKGAAEKITQPLAPDTRPLLVCFWDFVWSMFVCCCVRFPASSSSQIDVVIWLYGWLRLVGCLKI